MKRQPAGGIVRHAGRRHKGADNQPAMPRWASGIIVNQAAMLDCSEFQQPARFQTCIPGRK